MAESHYPECDLFDPICTGNSGGHIPRWMVGHACVACKKPCICSALRACEQRVRDEIAADGPWFRSVVHQCCEDKHTAYAAGVQAARDAVAAECSFGQTLPCSECQAALAAIDALKEKP